jgi:hypothetical protein
MMLSFILGSAELPVFNFPFLTHCFFFKKKKKGTPMALWRFACSVMGLGGIPRRSAYGFREQPVL